MFQANMSVSLFGHKLNTHFRALNNTTSYLKRHTIGLRQHFYRNAQFFSSKKLSISEIASIGLSVTTIKLSRLVHVSFINLFIFFLFHSQ